MAEVNSGTNSAQRSQSHEHMFAVAFEDGRVECHMWGRPWAAPGADELPRMRQLLRLPETAT